MRRIIAIANQKDGVGNDYHFFFRCSSCKRRELPFGMIIINARACSDKIICQPFSQMIY